MTRLIPLLCLAALPLAAETLSAQERDFLLAHLDKSAATFLKSIEGVSEAQWKFKAAPDRWSIGECAEHIVTTDEMLFVFVSQKIVNLPVPAEKPARVPDAEVLASAVDRSKKVKTAEFLEPKSRFATRADLVEAFRKSRAKVAEYARTTQDDLRAHGFKGAAGFRDAYQQLLGLSAHAERHTLQIEEVKAEAGYPRR